MIDLKIITPKGEYLHEPVKSMQLTSVEGQFMLLPHHIPFVAALVPCPLTIVTESGEKKVYAISGGFVHFDHDEALLLTDAIEGSGDIDLERAQKAYKRARERIDKKDVNTNMKRAELSLERAINRIHISEKK